MENYSNFMVYVDESGDHSLLSIDKNYPVFVLAFCVFYKNHYLEKVVPKVQKLKFDCFGHDMIILHEHDIKKEKEPFNIFKSSEEKVNFIHKLTRIMEDINFVLIACVIHKDKLSQKEETHHPYHFALKLCLETLYEFVSEKNQENKITYIALESRGKKEDDDLELEFLRICKGQNKFKKMLPFKIKIVSKQINSVGLQLADLVARPIGRYILNPEQGNRAFDILKRKFYCEGGRDRVGEKFDQKGLKHFPV